MLPFAFSLVSSIAQAQNAPGANIDSAVVIDLSDEGLNEFVPIITTLIPPAIDVPQFSDSYCQEVCLFGACTCVYEYAYDITNGWASVNVTSAELTPSTGEIALDAVLTVQINDPTDPLSIYLFGEAVSFIGIEETCAAWVDPFEVTIHGSLALALDQNGQAQVSMAPIDWNWTLVGDDFTLEDCGPVSTLTDFLDVFGVDVFGIILGAIEPQIGDAITGLTADLDLETTVQDALDSATIDEEFDLAGVPLSVHVEPSDIEIAPEGIRIVLDGSVDAPPNACVEPYAQAGSLQTLSTISGIGDFPTGLPFAPHLGVYVDDDLVNEAMFAIWNGGLLCQTIDDSMDLPVSIDTTLLGIFAPDTFDDIFPESAPMLIETRPFVPPVATVDGPHDIDIDIERLGLDFYAELDGRMSRQFRVDLQVNVGTDILFDGQTGNLAVNIDLGEDSIVATTTDNEFAPQANARISENILGLADSLLGTLLGDTLSGIAFDLPSFEGFGLVQTTVQAAGSTNDRIGVYGTVGAVPYTGAGCGQGGGCGAGSGCSGGGCSSGQAPAQLIFLVPLVLAGLRRRQE